MENGVNSDNNADCCLINEDCVGEKMIEENVGNSEKEENAPNQVNSQSAKCSLSKLVLCSEKCR